MNTVGTSLCPGHRQLASAVAVMQIDVNGSAGKKAVPSRGEAGNRENGACLSPLGRSVCARVHAKDPFSRSIRPVTLPLHKTKVQRRLGTTLWLRAEHHGRADMC